MAGSIHLVPPTLPVLGKIISKRIPLTEHFASLHDYLSHGWTLEDAETQGFPRLRFATRGIGGGLAVACTTDDDGTLLWIYEVSCHELCGLTGKRECSHAEPMLDRIRLVKITHRKYLQTMPGYETLSPRAISPAKKEG